MIDPAGPHPRKRASVLDTEMSYADISAEPGSHLIGRACAFCRTWPNQEEITVPGIPFIQEDSPGEIGAALARFVDRARIEPS